MQVFQPLTQRRPLVGCIPRGIVRIPLGLACRGSTAPRVGAVLTSLPGRSATVVESFTRTVSRRVKPYSDQAADAYRARRHETYSDEVQP